LRFTSAASEEASLILGDFWLSLDLSTATVEVLYEAVINFMKVESPYSSEIGDHLSVKLMDLHSPQQQLAVADDMLLRDLCWTHSETLTIHIDQCPGNRAKQAKEVRICREQELAQEALVDQVLQRHQQLEHLSIASPQCSSEKDSFSDANSLASEWTAQSRHSNDRAILEAGIEGALARLMPHYPPQMITNTQQTRQFEFHPCLPHIVLVGDTRGGVNIVQTDNENVRPRVMVDHTPVIALSWMHHNPHTAVCGTADAGNINFLRYDSEADSQEVALQQVLKIESFPRLSSLSVNCTDDFLLASGSTHDVSVYDIQSGKVVQRAFGVHNHSINVSRFAHNSPHVFATASFDNTCKVWDIRQPMHGNSATKVLHTGGPNVMCAFSPGDKYLLCSGIDTHIVQYDLPTFSVTHKSFPLRPEAHQSRYRRSMYFASGRHFLTSATHESHIRIMSASGLNLGVIDFQGALRNVSQQGGDAPIHTGLQQRPTKQGRPSWFFQRSMGREEPLSVLWDSSLLMRGDVRLDGRASSEYVQSVRTHPIVENCAGVLISSHDPEAASCLSLLHVAPNQGSW
jgi:WD40 repeat protein